MVVESVSRPVRAAGRGRPGSYKVLASTRRRVSRGAGAGAGVTVGAGWQRKPRDEAAVYFLARFGPARIELIARAFYRGVLSTARTRVQYMVESGLLERSSNVTWAGTVLWPTAYGMRVAEMESLSPPPSPTEDRLLHKLLVAESAWDFEERGLTVLGERQVRSWERGDPDTAREAAARFGLRGTPGTDADGRARYFGIPVRGAHMHYPDSLVVADGSLIAVEVEITAKVDARVRATLVGYRHAIERGQVRQVLWSVTPAVRAQLEGYEDTQRNWVDGLLTQTGLMPPGRPDWTQKRLPVSVRPVQPKSDGLAYAVDQRALPGSLQCGFRQWTRWKREWLLADTPLDFGTWLTLPGNAARLRAQWS